MILNNKNVFVVMHPNNPNYLINGSFGPADNIKYFTLEKHGLNVGDRVSIRVAKADHGKYSKYNTSSTRVISTPSQSEFVAEQTGFIGHASGYWHKVEGQSKAAIFIAGAAILAFFLFRKKLLSLKP